MDGLRNGSTSVEWDSSGRPRGKVSDASRKLKSSGRPEVGLGHQGRIASRIPRPEEAATTRMAATSSAQLTDQSRSFDR